MSKKVKTGPTGKRGRPKTTKEQFNRWLDEMRPYLVLGCSLNRAMERAGLISHEFTIREKYKDNDDFSRKIDQFRSTPGENVNEALVRLVNQILDKIKREELLTRQDTDILKHFSEKHRTAQPFFVSRSETAEAKDEDFGKVVETPVINYIVPKEGPEKKKDDTKKDDQSQAAEDNIQADAQTAPGVEKANGQDNQ